MNNPPLAESPRGTCVDPGFGNFLYAQIGEEASGMQLSVLSALARQNVDPWAIARHLTALPPDAAIQSLVPMLAHIPRAASDGAAPEDIAARLVALLPARQTSGGEPGFFLTEQKGAPPVAMADKIRLIIAFMLFMLVSQLLLSGLMENAPVDKPASSSVEKPMAPGH